MLLPKRQVEQIIRGTKTQMRLPVRGHSDFRVGKSYPIRQIEKVRDDDEPLRCRVICVDTAKHALGEITLKEAIVEGHRTTDDFKCWWIARYDRSFRDETQEVMLERFEKYHAHRFVVMLRFRLDTTQRPRLMAPSVGRGRGMGDYTENPGRAMRDEGEAIDDHTQRWFTADAHDRALGMPGRREEALHREATQLSRRLSNSVRAVDASSIEVATQLERIRREIIRLEGLRKAA